MEKSAGCDRLRLFSAWSRASRHETTKFVSLSALLEFPRTFPARRGPACGKKRERGERETVRRRGDEEREERIKWPEDEVVGRGRRAVVLGRCIVGVLAFNLTAQFH